MIIISVTYLVQSATACRDVNDWFIIPDIECDVVIDGKKGHSEWQEASSVSFGALGAPEVYVLGQYSNDHLYLYFYADIVTFQTLDKFTLCFDANNSGCMSDPGILKFEIFRKDQSRRFYHLISSRWQPVSDNSHYLSHFTACIHEDKSKHYCEVEIDIDCSASNPAGINLDGFGVYFQFLDFLNNVDFIRHFWPASADGAKDDPYYCPPASQWANGRIKRLHNQVEGDLFFKQGNLRIGNPVKDLEIKLKTMDSAETRIQNIIFQIISDSYMNGQHQSDTFLVKFAAQVFDTVTAGDTSIRVDTNARAQTALKNIDREMFVYRNPQPDRSSKNVSESKYYASGARGIHRGAVWLNIKARKTIDAWITITNSKDTSTPLFSEIEIAGDRTSNELTAVLVSRPPEQSDENLETLYFFLDCSGLKTMTGWNLNFASVNEGDLIVPAGSANGLHWAKFYPGARKRFRLQITAPTKIAIETTGDYVPTAHNMLNLAAASELIILPDPDKVDPGRQVENNQVQTTIDDAWRPHDRLPEIQVKVYRSKNTLAANDSRIFQQLETLGYLNVNLKFMPEAGVLQRLFPFILAVVVIVAGVLYYFLRKPVMVLPRFFIRKRYGFRV